jgi:hypothetical protein
MRRLLFLAAFLAALPAAAQQAPKLEPLPEPPPPPPGLLESSMEPQVTITTRGADKVEEYRMNGKLYMLKVTPPGGTPYYLIDNRGDGAWMRQDGLDGSSLRVPQWVIGTF